MARKHIHLNTPYPCTEWVVANERELTEGFIVCDAQASVSKVELEL
jgi:hypothetical protein